MVSFYLFSETHAWLVATAVLIVSLVVHAAARPYEDEYTDWAEFLTLIANLLVLVSGPVFMVITESDESHSAQQFRSGLEVAIGMVMAAAILATAHAQYTVWQTVRATGLAGVQEDYKIRMVKQRLAESASTAESLERQLIALEESKHELEKRDEVDQQFANPVALGLNNKLSSFANLVSVDSEGADQEDDQENQGNQDTEPPPQRRQRREAKVYTRTGTKGSSKSATSFDNPMHGGGGGDAGSSDSGDDGD